MKRIATAAIALGLLAGPALAQNPDVLFWQSIQNSTNPAEYQAYLNAFPNGQYAELARIRLVNPPLQTTVVGPAPGTVAPVGTMVVPPAGAPVMLAPGAVAPPTAPVLTSIPATSVTMSTDQVSYAAGQPIVVRYAGMPPYRGEYIILVPADTPDAVITSTSMQAASNRDNGQPTGPSGAVEFGGLLPGAYEARLVSQALNPGVRWDVIGRHGFTVQ